MTNPTDRHVEEGAPSLWRTWISPGSNFALVVNLSEASIRTVPRGAQTLEGEFALDPPGQETHRELARSFLQSRSDIGDEEKAKLDEITHRPSKSWWVAWLDKLRRFLPTAFGDWFEFRAAEFRELLKTSLEERGVVEPVLDRLLQAVRADELKQAGLRGARRPRAVTVFPKKQPFRLAVLAVISKMSDEELRELRLPAGRLFDSLAGLD